MKSFLSSLFQPSAEKTARQFRTQLATIKTLLVDYKEQAEITPERWAKELRQRTDLSEQEKVLYAMALFALVMDRGRQIVLHDSQFIGALSLVSGRLAEMPTGEGKTFTAAMAAFARWVLDMRTKIVTVNEYLAMRDAAEMKGVFQTLGLSICPIVSGLDHQTKQRAYQADVVYLTQSQLGFDYLRDNMVTDERLVAQSLPEFVIVDEADSVLIDEAGTPLIISGEPRDWADAFVRIKAAIDPLTGRVSQEGALEGNEDVDFVLHPKDKQVVITDKGFERLEYLLADADLIPEEEGILYRPQFAGIMDFVTATLLAEHLYERDKDYVIQNDRVVIVDEMTGRLMPDRRWGNGIHQAIEVHESVPVSPVAKDLATISLQNLFRRFEVLAGMTGTAATNADELEAVYGLQVDVIPSVFEQRRSDHPDKIYVIQSACFDAVVAAIAEKHAKGQPVLVGTTFVEASEKLSSLLTEKGIAHNVLNAKQHEKEASIIANAGRRGAVTIATNMAGRGTDILLGGHTDDKRDLNWIKDNQEVIDLGGLSIIGLGRNDSSRIDNQLRGRSGRQGDPGESGFYVSLQDSLITAFFEDRAQKLLADLGVADDALLSSPFIAKMVDNAQRKMEEHQAESRRDLTTYDNVFNEQRELVYGWRKQFMGSQNHTALLKELQKEKLQSAVVDFCPADTPVEAWSVKGLQSYLYEKMGLEMNVEELIEGLDKNTFPTPEELFVALEGKAGPHLEQRIETLKQQFVAAGHDLEKGEVWRGINTLLLNVIDQAWRGHLGDLNNLRQGIHLRSYAQKEPGQAFREEAITLLDEMVFDTSLQMVFIANRVSTITPAN